jgi:predicted GNAT family acetyltransferase
VAGFSKPAITLATMADVEVHDNPDKSRFELTVDGAPAGFAAYRIRDGLVIVTHSEVDHAHRGEGLGARLVTGTLDALRERGARVVPSCPFFAGYVAEHHDWDDILAE